MAHIRAEVEAENTYEVNLAPYPQDGGCSLCSAYVHCIIKPAHYAGNQMQQLQAEEEEQGQRLDNQLSSAAAFLDVRLKGGRPTNAGVLPTPHG
jgi:hypothetical protein